MLGKNKSVKVLKLCCDSTGIGDETCKAIAKALRINSTLEDIDLSRNWGITRVGAAAIQNAIKHTNYTVTDIELHVNCVEDDDDSTSPSSSGDNLLLGRSIRDLCLRNRRLKRFFQQFNENNPATIPLGAWPKVLEVVKCKPDLLFALLKTKPDVCWEPPSQGRQNKRKSEGSSHIG